MAPWTLGGSQQKKENRIMVLQPFRIIQKCKHINFITLWPSLLNWSSKSAISRLVIFRDRCCCCWYNCWQHKLHNLKPSESHFIRSWITNCLVSLLKSFQEMFPISLVPVGPFVKSQNASKNLLPLASS